MSEFTMTIDGKKVAGEKSFEVINPATGQVFAEAPECTEDQLDMAMEAAERAFLTWRQDEAKRREVLLDCAKVINAHANDLAEVLTREQGMPLNLNIMVNQYSASCYEVAAKFDLPSKVIQDNEEARIEVRRKPYGVVGGITPWNGPILLASWKIAPALLAGNTMVLKPSPFAPLATLMLGEILREVVPPGVLNIVSGGDELGAQITKHPAVRKISFTGSVETGKEVALAAAPDFKRINLELGGNDAAIVLPDVDPKKVAEKLFWGAFLVTGQVCMAIKRLYVHESIYQPLLQEIAEIARNVKVGDGFDPTTEMGPLCNKQQYKRIIELVEDAKQADACMVTGGHPLEGPGFFYPPTIVTDILEGTRLVDEEQFGPALPIMPFSSVDEALERANATHFGLCGSIWTSDLERGAELASQLECGTAWVNQHNVLMSPTIPFGGVKWSGIGVQHGPWGIDELTELQVINIAKG